MRKLILVCIVLLMAPIVNAQAYPPELAGEQTMFGPEQVRLVITAVDGCPYSHANAVGFYYLTTLRVTPGFASITLHGFYSPAGVQIGNAPIEEPIVLEWNESADCYLWEGDNFRFYSLTYDGTGFVERNGRFEPQQHCCPWYEFDTRYCLWVHVVEATTPFRSPFGDTPVDVR